MQIAQMAGEVVLSLTLHLISRGVNMVRIRTVVVVSFLLTVLIAVCPKVGLADTINSSSTGLASPASTITFSEVVLPGGTPLTTQYSAFGVIFSPGFTYDPQPGFFSTASIGNFQPITDPVSIFFNSAVNAAAFQFITNPGDSTTFTALLNGSALASFTTPTDLSQLWFGFSNLTFNQIEINVTTNVNGAFLLDNLQSTPAAVPEPASVLLLGAGILAISGASARKKRHHLRRSN
jgi:PEP-CTERM motif